MGAPTASGGVGHPRRVCGHIGACHTAPLCPPEQCSQGATSKQSEPNSLQGSVRQPAPQTRAPWASRFRRGTASSAKQNQGRPQCPAPSACLSVPGPGRRAQGSLGPRKIPKLGPGGDQESEAEGGERGGRCRVLSNSHRDTLASSSQWLVCKPDDH